MRKLIAAVVLGLGALASAPVLAADMPYEPVEVEVTPIDIQVGGSFYLRGSAAANWFVNKRIEPGCPHPCGGYNSNYDFSKAGFGYSVGAGFGFETGTGLRTDLTVDYIHNNGLTVKYGGYGNLRSGLVLANAYYDFGLNGHGQGGFGAYLGAGIGFAQNYTETHDTLGTSTGTSIDAAVAGMAGVSYDFGQVVADVGYRGIYMNQISNSYNKGGTANAIDYLSRDNMIHEVRSTVRYRFN